MNITNALATGLASLETPVVLVDRGVLSRNIDRAAKIARTARLDLRPHVKTHKSLAIARLQVAAGAVGIMVAKADEAVAMMEGGIRDVTVGQPLVDVRKVLRLLEKASQTRSRITLIADSHEGIAVIGAAAAGGAVVDLQIKVDVGLHRCGVDPSGTDAIAIAHAVAAYPALRFAGILSHAGHAYSADGPDAIRAIADAERATMIAVAAKILATGLAVPGISVGSTPTVWLGETLDGVTEIRPGNYVFMDLTQVSLGVATRADIALAVFATVISRNNTFAIVDAGSKVLSSDCGPHGSQRLSGHGVARRLVDGCADMPVVRLSEEHGFVAHSGTPPEIGERLLILPNHACPVANLARSFTVIDGANVIEQWPIEASGLVR